MQRKASAEENHTGLDFSHPSGGQPLPASERSFFEPRFGRNFGEVRVHANAHANEAARNVNALAYTMGHDVVFGEGQYQPGTNPGRSLIAHELAHVVQQGAAGTAPPSTASSGMAHPTISRSPATDLPSVQRLGNLSQRPARLICDPPTTAARLSCRHRYSFFYGW